MLHLKCKTMRVMKHENSTECMHHVIAHITIDSQMFYRFYNTKLFGRNVRNFEFLGEKFRVTFCPELTIPECKDIYVN